jgi:hypothetical protein
MPLRSFWGCRGEPIGDGEDRPAVFDDLHTGG